MARCFVQYFRRLSRRIHRWIDDFAGRKTRLVGQTTIWTVPRSWRADLDVFRREIYPLVLTVRESGLTIFLFFRPSPLARTTVANKHSRFLPILGPSFASRAR